jgi:hypothetical protein
LGLLPKVTTPEAQNPSGPVIQQDPQPGTPLQPGGWLNLTTPSDGVAKQPKKIPPQPLPTTSGDSAAVQSRDRPAPAPKAPQTPAPSLATAAFDWFWDGLNPLLVPALAIAGILAWRFWPRPPVPVPSLSVKMQRLEGSIRFGDPARAVLTAPSIRCTLTPMPPMGPCPFST